MNPNRRRNLRLRGVIPLDLSQLSLLRTRNDDNQQGVQEAAAEENSSADQPTNNVLLMQNIDGYIFPLPRDYLVERVLGSGAHGVVAEVSKLPADKRLAIKQIKLNLEPSTDDDENLNRWRRAFYELLVLRQLREKGVHPNVIKLEEVFFTPMQDEYRIMFLTNLMETSLDDLMKSRPLTDEERRLYTYQIFAGLHHLHSSNIIHRDLKPANLLVRGAQLCIADFGQARVIAARGDEISALISADNANDQILTNYGIGTFAYRAPELHAASHRYTSSVDQWSVGCIFSEMFLRGAETLVNGETHGENPFVMFVRIFQLVGTPTSSEDIDWLPGFLSNWVKSQCSEKPLRPDWSRLSNVDETARSLIEKLLTFNPSKRITAKEALQHEYFMNLNMPNSDVVPNSPSSPFIWPVELYQYRTTQEVRDAIGNEILRLTQND